MGVYHRFLFVCYNNTVFVTILLFINACFLKKYVVKSKIKRSVIKYDL